MRWAALLIGLSLLSTSASAVAAAPNRLAVGLGVREERVVASFDVMSALDEEFRRRVDGGLESRVEIGTRLLDARGDVVGQGGRSCKLLYSLWDEQVFVSITDVGSTRARIMSFETVEPALEACAQVRNLEVALAGALSLSKGYRLQVRVVLNPVSEEMVERSRQFITNPRGGARGRPNAVLGAVAGLFGEFEGALGNVAAYESEPLRRPAAGTTQRLAGTSTGSKPRESAAP